jgi:alginate O-acetyltransferase complex protein AlgI
MNLGFLGYFKYYDFFVSSAQNIVRDLGLAISPHIVAITLPVGISFFTFQALSYVVDVYRGNFEPVPLGEFAVYLSFFPHLVAGPIVRAAEFLPQLHERHDPRRVDGSRAFFLVASGLFKKVVIANFLATEIVDKVFASPGRHSGLETLIAIYAYAVQIYADFSGYTDIAIGLALMLGFRFPQNFDAPYSARSLQDFWRRWHMTLSRWLRDYLYIPLGGNRRGRLATYRNLMLTFVLGGLWHGAAWTFVVWGTIHGAVLALEHWRHEERIARGLPEVEDTWRRRLGERLVTFHIVCLAWVFFRADSFSNAADVLGRLFHWAGSSPLVTPWVLLAIAVGIGSQYVPGRAFARLMSEFSRLSPFMQGAALGVGLLVINVLGPRGVAPFIYFKF